MAPKGRTRGASATSSRGRSSRDRRGRGARASRAARCQRGRGGSSGGETTASVGAGVCSQNFVLYIRGRIVGRVLLPSYFSFFVFELGLDGLYLDPQGYSYCP